MLCVKSVLIAAVVLLTAVPAPAWTKFPEGKKAYGETKPDKALVYVIRPKSRVGSVYGKRVFANDQFLAFLKNNTYTFTYLDAGEYLIWSDSGKETLEVGLAPGRAYYITFMPFGLISLSVDAAGKDKVEKTGAYIQNDEKDRADAAGKARSRFAKARRNEENKGKAKVEDVIPAPRPENTEGLLKVPAYTPVRLELMENVTSALNHTGENIWFRVKEDATVAGQAFVSKGTGVKATVRRARPGHSFGEGGALEITIPAVPAADGTAIPVVGQVAAAGKEEEDVLMAGAILALLIKGKEAYHLAGAESEVFTRDINYVNTAQVQPAVATPHPAKSEIKLKAESPKPVIFSPHSSHPPADIEIQFDTAEEIHEVNVTSVGGWILPQAVKPARLVQDKGRWKATFRGWDVARFLRLGKPSTTLILGGTLGNGQTFAAEAQITMTTQP